MIYWQLFFEFFKIGCFSFGGGYATIPFLYHIAQQYSWYTFDELSIMTAVASITPGPIGINVATFAGMNTAGVWGALIATLAEMIPSLILVIVVSKLLKKFSENFYVKTIIQTLKPISCALLVSVGFGLIKPEINNIQSIILIVLLLLMSIKNKKEPLFYFLFAGFFGVLSNIFSSFFSSLI